METAKISGEGVENCVTKNLYKKIFKVESEQE